MNQTIDWSKTDCPETIDLIVAEYLPLAETIARKRIRNLVGHIDHDAVFSAANAGLLNAIRSFVPGKASFRTYARLRIDFTITDCLRDIDLQSRKDRLQLKQDAEKTVQLSHSLGHAPSEEEFLESTGAKRLKKFDSESIDTPHSRTLTAKRIVSELDQGESFRMATRGLSQDEQTILYLYYYKSARMKDIGMVMGLSESRVSQLCASGLQSLRKYKGRVFDALASR